MDTVDYLTAVYNNLIVKKNLWQGYVYGGQDQLTITIAQAKVDAYTDAANVVLNQITSLGG